MAKSPGFSAKPAGRAGSDHAGSDHGGTAAGVGQAVGEALSDMSDVGTTDPNGFKLMVMCIGLLFFLACSLIGGTIWYMLKSKKKTK